MQGSAAKGQQQLLDKIGESGGRMTEFGSATAGASAPVNTLRSSLGAFDQMLSAVGLNMGREIRAIGEMGDAAGKTMSQLGLLSTAGLALAAAIGGWKIGRLVAEFFGLDQAIGNATSRLMGWGDLVAETAGSKQDVINRAIANGAKETISFSEAIKFNIQHLQDQNDKHAVSRERLADAQREVRQLSAATIEAIEIAKKNGATTEEITRVYGISADGLRALAERQKLAGQAADAHTNSIEKQQAALEKINTDYAKRIDLALHQIKVEDLAADASARATEALNKKNAAAAGWISQQVAVTKGITDEATATKAYLAEQDALTAATDALGQTHTEAGAAAVSATAQASAGYSMLGQQVNITGEAIRALMELSKFSAASNAILQENSLFTTRSQLERLSQIKTPGSSPTVQNTFNIVDTEANIARRVSEQIMQSVRAGTQLAGA